MLLSWFLLSLTCHIQPISIFSWCYLYVTSRIQPLTTLTAALGTPVLLPSAHRCLSPGWLQKPLSEFPASTFDPLYFIFHTAARVLLLKLVKLCQFSAHMPPIDFSEWNTKSLLWPLTLSRSTSPTVVTITVVQYTNCASASGPLHLLSPLSLSLFHWISSWFPGLRFFRSLLRLDVTLAAPY